MRKPTKGSVALPLIVPIVGDAAIAGPPADGRLIPVLILDTTEHPAVDELIRVHDHLSPGDALSTWAILRGVGDVVLLLTFERPIAAEIALRFNVEREAILVETMLTGGAVYLQSGAAGDRLSTTLDAPRVLVELPDSGFRTHWDAHLKKLMTTLMARRLGLGRRPAAAAALTVIAELKRLAAFRMRR